MLAHFATVELQRLRDEFGHPVDQGRDLFRKVALFARVLRLAGEHDRQVRRLRDADGVERNVPAFCPAGGRGGVTWCVAVTMTKVIVGQGGFSSHWK